MYLVLPEARLGRHSWALDRAYVFGVINVTPDSFSDGGQFLDPVKAVERGRALAAAGADALDVGGESTRPRSEAVSLQAELDRVLPVIERLSAELDLPISVDTYKAEVARQAVAVGASIINDISGMGLDPKMGEVAADTQAAIILGHLRGSPATMQDDISFVDVVSEVGDELRARVQLAVAAGVAPERIWIDPGIGFGKTAPQSLALLAAIDVLKRAVGYPLMIGASRKSFIGELTGAPSAERLMGTAAATSAAIVLGADAVRIHDVGELEQAVVVANAIRNAPRGGGR